MTWTRTGDATWALGEFGAVKGLRGRKPWIAVIGGRLLGLYHTVEGAQAAIERAWQWELSAGRTSARPGR